MKPPRPFPRPKGRGTLPLRVTLRLGAHRRSAPTGHARSAIQQRGAVVLWLLCLLAPSISRAQAADRQPLERTAALLISVHETTVHPTVKIQWDESAPLTLGYNQRRDGPAIWGEIEYRDERGHQSMLWAVSLPPTPDSQKILRRGENWQVTIDSDALPNFPKSGRYSATASFFGWSDGRSVKFTTNTYWFEVHVSAPGA